MSDIELVIKIPKEIYERFGYEYREENLISKHTNEIILDAFCNGNPLNEVLQEIRQEIEKPLRDERCYDTVDAKAQYIALNWCVEIIDKYRAESNDEWDRVTMIDVDGNEYIVNIPERCGE